MAIDCVLLAHFYYTTVQLNAETALSSIVTARDNAAPPSVPITASPINAGGRAVKRTTSVLV